VNRSCDACRAAIGKLDNKTSAVTFMKRQNIAEQKEIAKAQRKLSVQQKSDQTHVTTSCSDNSDALEISQITDVIDPLSNIKESLANIRKASLSFRSRSKNTTSESMRTNGKDGKIGLMKSSRPN